MQSWLSSSSEPCFTYHTDGSGKPRALSITKRLVTAIRGRSIPATASTERSSSFQAPGDQSVAMATPRTRPLKSRCVVRFSSGDGTVVVGESGAPRERAGFAEWRDEWAWE